MLTEYLLSSILWNDSFHYFFLYIHISYFFRIATYESGILVRISIRDVCFYNIGRGISRFFCAEVAVWKICMKAGIFMSRQNFASNYILSLLFADVSLNEMEFENTI